MRRVERPGFTAATSAPKGGTKPSKVTAVFKKSALIDMSSQPLDGRVTIPKGLTKKGKDFLKQARKILGKIPTPFLVKAVSGRGSK